ncbi:MAG: hypothetical protein PHH49_04800 [Candidatus Omnitrophica bacterium]|nr:hypothetical protein [Candidatus Omnitrophota bacterium]MDD5488264.1 hypothetical protein [Candidatus Omnitrophota bacterium]
MTGVWRIRFLAGASVAVVLWYGIQTAVMAQDSTDERAGEDRAAIISGKVMFMDYYPLGGERCTAFMDTGRNLVCVVDTHESALLKDEFNGEPTDVKLIGTVRESHNGISYLTVKQYKKTGEPQKEEIVPVVEPGSSVSGQLKELSDLFSGGFLTEQEFIKAKQKVLDQDKEAR